MEDGLIQVLIHAEQAVLIIEHEFFAEEAEFDDLIHPELLPECLILLPEIPVFQELFHRKVIAVLRINDAVAIIADVVPFDLPRKQPLYLAAADGARGSFIKQAHYKILLSHIFRGAAPFDHSIAGNRARYKEKSVNFPGANRFLQKRKKHLPCDRCFYWGNGNQPRLSGPPIPPCGGCWPPPILPGSPIPPKPPIPLP